MPGRFRPTPTHHFIRLLERKGLLLRCFTQNIDGLERVAGISPERIVEAHGSFADAHCVACRRQHGIRWWRERIEAGDIPRCEAVLEVKPPPPAPSETDVEALRRKLEEATLKRKEDIFSLANQMAVARAKREVEQAEEQMVQAPLARAKWEAEPKSYTCEGLVKPDIVFFGEGLPPRFSYLAARDGAGADLLIVMGTSLQVMPFAGIIGRVGPLCPRLLVNREAVGVHGSAAEGLGNVGLRVTDEQNYRDVHLAEDCDAGVRRLCALVGWEGELGDLEKERAKDADAFEALAQKQGTESTFEETEAPELARRLYDAMRRAGGAAAGLPAGPGLEAADAAGPEGAAGREKAGAETADAAEAEQVAEHAGEPAAAPEDAAEGRAGAGRESSSLAPLACAAPPRGGWPAPEEGLGRGHFVAAAEFLARAGDEPLLVAFADKPLRASESMAPDELAEMLQTPFRALGRESFRAVAERHARVLEAAQGAAAEQVRAGLQAFRSLDAGGQGLVDRFNVLSFTSIFNGSRSNFRTF